MLRHVVLLSDLSTESDGPTTVALTAARVLRKKNIEVTYVCGDNGESAELASIGVRIVAVRGKEIAKANPFNAALFGLYSRDAARVVGNVIREVDGEGVVYHLHNWSKILSPSIFRVLDKVSERLFISTHDYFLACPNGGYFNFQKKQPCELVPLSAACLGTNCDRRSYFEKFWRVARSVVRLALIDLSRKRATILAVHDGMVDHLIRGGISADSITVLRNPVTPWSEKRISAENNRKFLFVGRLDHDKGAELLAGSARRAGVPLQMVGDGHLRSFLEQAYPEIDLLGWRPRGEIARISKDARAVVMPTGSRETFGLVAFEALTSGLPVIISKFAATCDEIVRNGIGLSCDPYDASALADALRRLDGDDDNLRLMSERAWKLRDSLSASNEEWGNRLIALYERAGESSDVLSRMVAADGA